MDNMAGDKCTHRSKKEMKGCREGCIYYLLCCKPAHQVHDAQKILPLLSCIKIKWLFVFAMHIFPKSQVASNKKEKKF